ncbi:MAG TPA: N-acetyl-gamma-glutamyl-phosphate reductase [Vicinamibacteria bacterium]|nr:N-acetyl-gamma-glutamyl-phosphate reductase [Vicinamibacteria bacterium]
MAKAGIERARVGVFGATGYVGREAVRLLSAHPGVEVVFSTGSGAGHLAHERGLDQPADAFLLALPHGVSATYAATLRERYPQAVVIDLSGDLRLPDAASYSRWYHQDHPSPALLGQAPYGLTEIYRDRLRQARLIANPGCYATSVLLPLVPLLRSGLVASQGIVVDAKSGATGAGRTLREDLLFCELLDDFSAYSPGRSHRHLGEMEAVLRDTTGHDLALTFCPHLLPVRRGILSSLYLQSQAPADELRQVLASFYAEAPFVRVGDGRPPRLSEVVGTNECHLSVHSAAPGQVVVFSALDNLLKGASGQAVQNLNLALGLPETTGLARANGA